MNNVDAGPIICLALVRGYVFCTKHAKPHGFLIHDVYCAPKPHVYPFSANDSRLPRQVIQLKCWRALQVPHCYRYNLYLVPVSQSLQTPTASLLTDSYRIEF